MSSVSCRLPYLSKAVIVQAGYVHNIFTKLRFQPKFSSTNALASFSKHQHSSISQAELQRLANLTKLAIPDNKLSSSAAAVASVLGWMTQISEVNTEHVEPLHSLVDDVPLFLDDDNQSIHASDEAVLANAPQPEGRFFTCPP